ncbi:hypothetical protein E4U54_007414 [Claviceps lovelessii]|nr:hypothetical protein E4U54_007414 [Claviceps lovelessii]
MAAENAISPAFLTLPLTIWTLLTTLVLLFVAYGYRKLQPRPFPGIPYNKDIGILGDIPALLKARKAGCIRPWLWGVAKRHKSPITQVLLLPFTKPLVIVSDYQESYDIMCRRTKEFDRARLNVAEFIPFVPEHHVVMMSSDPRFRANRELVKGLMSPRILSDAFVPVIYEKARHLIDLWKVKMDAAEGRPFSAIRDLQELAMEITLALVLGVDDGRKTTQRHQEFLTSKGSSAVCDHSADIACFARPQLTPEVEALAMMTKFLQFAITCIAPHLQVWILKKTRWRKYFQRKEKLLSDEINKSVKRLSTAGCDSSDCKTVIDHILMREATLAKKTESRPNFHKPSIRDELFGFVIAGSDTVSTTMSWTVKYLADNQMVQAKLRRQLRGSYKEAHDSKRQPDASEILHVSAPYLDAFIEESLRYAKAVPILVREAIVDTEILGHHIPKGTSIFMIAGGASVTEPTMPIAHEARSPSSQVHGPRVPRWDDDDITQFKPERWLKTSSNSSTTRTAAGEFDNVEFDPNAGPTLAFGAGPRGCFGKRLGYLEMRIMIALLVWNFSFEQCAAHLSTHAEYDEFTCVPTHCYVKLEGVE